MSRIKRTISTSIDLELKEMLERTARQEDRSAASIIRLALKQYLEKRGYITGRKQEVTR